MRHFRSVQYSASRQGIDRKKAYLIYLSSFEALSLWEIPEVPWNQVFHMQYPCDSVRTGKLLTLFATWSRFLSFIWNCLTKTVARTVIIFLICFVCIWWISTSENFSRKWKKIKSPQTLVTTSFHFTAYVLSSTLRVASFKNLIPYWWKIHIWSTLNRLKSLRSAWFGILSTWTPHEHRENTDWSVNSQCSISETMSFVKIIDLYQKWSAPLNCNRRQIICTTKLRLKTDFFSLLSFCHPILQKILLWLIQWLAADRADLFHWPKLEEKVI